MKTLRLFLIVALVALVTPLSAEVFELVGNGTARLPIVVAENATDRVRTSAQTLASYLPVEQSHASNSSMTCPCTSPLLLLEGGMLLHEHPFRISQRRMIGGKSIAQLLHR